MNNTWYRHTLSHNTVLIDGENQPAHTGSLLRFEVGDAFSVADADVSWTDAGVYQGVRIRRGILWRGNYFIDLVRVTCPQTRQIDLAWHHTGLLDMPSLTASALQSDQAGYQHLTNIRETSAPEWRALWRTANGPGTQVWALNPNAALTLTADAPFNPASETMPLVLRRVTGTQALFLSVIEPFAQQPAIENVTWNQSADAVTIHVQGGGVDDRWRVDWVGGDSGAADGLFACSFVD